eukprot:TRINITY_DN870_c0_g1_i1.p1 TRINITY_DN870_c0_g1~~TRINITY_DN870_c0_g1_i1.p1  ORF type:complete len:256 (+),score=27.43 TRINITY_DN870_c0_g1_i1:147-914(+)
MRINQYFGLLIVASLFISAHCQCSIKNPNTGDVYDFSPLTKSSGSDYQFDTADGTYTFFWNMCADMVQSHGCNKAGQAALFAKGQSACRRLASGEPNIRFTDTNNPSGGVTLHYEQTGDFCYSISRSQPYSLDINILCDPESESSIQSVGLSASNGCSGYVNMKTKYACAKPGISGGWIFVIILVCVTFVYISGGCFYKRRQLGAEGMEAFPNVDFWRTVPGYVKDGCYYFWYLCRKMFSRCGCGTEPEVYVPLE